MSENLKKFVEIVAKDPEIAKKLSTTNKDEVNEKIKLAISIAKEKGIELVEKDFEVMTDDDLKAAAGGYETPNLNGISDVKPPVAGFFIVPVFFAANANIVANANLAVNVNVDANANVNANGNVSTNANIYD